MRPTLGLLATHTVGHLTSEGITRAAAPSNSAPPPPASLITARSSSSSVPMRRSGLCGNQALGTYHATQGCVPHTVAPAVAVEVDECGRHAFRALEDDGREHSVPRRAVQIEEAHDAVVAAYRYFPEAVSVRVAERWGRERLWGDDPSVESTSNFAAETPTGPAP